MVSISYQDLVNRRACERYQDEFMRLFGFDSVELNWLSAQPYALMFDWEWAIYELVAYPSQAERRLHQKAVEEIFQCHYRRTDAIDTASDVSDWPYRERMQRHNSNCYLLDAELLFMFIQLVNKYGVNTKKKLLSPHNDWLDEELV